MSQSQVKMEVASAELKKLINVNSTVLAEDKQVTMLSRSMAGFEKSAVSFEAILRFKNAEICMQPVVLMANGISAEIPLIPKNLYSSWFGNKRIENIGNEANLILQKINSQQATVYDVLEFYRTVQLLIKANPQLSQLIQAQYKPLLKLAENKIEEYRAHAFTVAEEVINYRDQVRQANAQEIESWRAVVAKLGREIEAKHIELTKVYAEYKVLNDPKEALDMELMRVRDSLRSISKYDFKSEEEFLDHKKDLMGREAALLQRQEQFKDPVWAATYERLAATKASLNQDITQMQGEIKRLEEAIIAAPSDHARDPDLLSAQDILVRHVYSNVAVSSEVRKAFIAEFFFIEGFRVDFLSGAQARAEQLMEEKKISGQPVVPSIPSQLVIELSSAQRTQPARGIFDRILGIFGLGESDVQKQQMDAAQREKDQLFSSAVQALQQTTSSKIDDAKRIYGDYQTELKSTIGRHVDETSAVTANTIAIQSIMRANKELSSLLLDAQSRKDQPQIDKLLDLRRQFKAELQERITCLKDLIRNMDFDLWSESIFAQLTRNGKILSGATPLNESTITLQVAMADNLINRLSAIFRLPEEEREQILPARFNQNLVDNLSAIKDQRDDLKELLKTLRVEYKTDETTAEVARGPSGSSRILTALKSAVPASVAAGGVAAIVSGGVAAIPAAAATLAVGTAVAFKRKPEAEVALTEKKTDESTSSAEFWRTSRDSAQQAETKGLPKLSEENHDAGPRVEE